MSVEWRHGTQRAPATSQEIQVVSAHLNAANIYPMVGGWQEIVRGATLFAASYIEEKIGNYNLDRTPLTAAVEIPNGHFLEKVRYAIAMVRALSSRPDEFQKAVARSMARGEGPDRWWRESEWTGRLRQAGYMPPVWWGGSLGEPRAGELGWIGTLVSVVLPIAVEYGTQWYAARVAEMGRTTLGAPANFEEALMMSGQLIDIRVAPANPEALQLPLTPGQIQQQKLWGFFKEHWTVFAIGAVALLPLFLGGKSE